MSESNKVLIQSVADRLQETARNPRRLIQDIVNVCGVEFTELMLENALTLYHGEGLMTNDGKRRRTLGGVFFYLVRGALPAKMRDPIFKAEQTAHRPAFPKRPGFDWETRQANFNKRSHKQAGKVIDMQIKVKGHPAHIEYRQDVVIVTLKGELSENGFPAGVPQPEDSTTLYYVYISGKQWVKNKGVNLEKNERMALAVEGECLLDEQLGAIAVFARKFKTYMPKVKRQEPVPPDELALPETASTQVVPANDESDLSRFPAALVPKLQALYGARKLFRKRLVDIEALPEDKQSGLKAAQMMLERTEAQIVELEHGNGE